MYRIKTLNKISSAGLDLLDQTRFQVGGQWVSKKQVKVNIPARPFLGLSDEDMQEIKATTEEFIGRDD